jgi:Leucine-rich repeat (LRR) protein
MIEDQEQEFGLNLLFGEDNEDDFEDSETRRAEEGYLEALRRIVAWEEAFEEDPDNDIETLDLSGLGLKTLPPLPDELRTLDCEDNLLQALPEPLPRSLLFLECSRNKLTCLPDPLPKHLRAVDCNYNALTELPAVLPSLLDRLQVEGNRLTKLPLLPRELDMISAERNMLTELPAQIPPHLKYLYLSKNRLERLPALPQTITFLTLDDNLITEFTEFPSSVESLYLCRNPVRGPLPPFPATLERLTICGLGLKSLPTLPPKLQLLRASENDLTSLPVLPKTLKDICVGHNRLTHLPTPLPPNLEVLGAVWNRIGHLPDPEEFPKTITSFWFDGNALPNEEDGESLEEYLAEVKRLNSKYKARITKRTQAIFEELMQLTWHPDRIDARRACGIQFEDM